jgi:hypothetical protein
VRGPDFFGAALGAGESGPGSSGACSGTAAWTLTVHDEIPPYYAALIVCTVTLLALVYAEGWIWPLKAAACISRSRSSSAEHS